MSLSIKSVLTNITPQKNSVLVAIPKLDTISLDTFAKGPAARSLLDTSASNLSKRISVITAGAAGRYWAANGSEDTGGTSTIVILAASLGGCVALGLTGLLLVQGISALRKRNKSPDLEMQTNPSNFGVEAGIAMPRDRLALRN